MQERTAIDIVWRSCYARIEKGDLVEGMLLTIAEIGSMDKEERNVHS